MHVHLRAFAAVLLIVGVSVSARDTSSGVSATYVAFQAANPTAVRYRVLRPRYRPDTFAFSPDGGTLLVGSVTSIEEWDLATGERRRTLAAAPEFITSVEFGADRKSVLSAHDDGSAFAWDYASGKRISELPPLGGAAGVSAISARDALVLTAIERGTPSPESCAVVVRDLASGKTRRTFKFESAAEDLPCGVRRLAISKSGRYAAASGYGNAVRFWDVKSGKEATVRDLQIRDADSLALDPNDRFLLIGVSHTGRPERSRTVLVVDLASRTVQYRLSDGEHMARALAVSPDGRLVAVGGIGSITIWNLVSQTPVERLVLEDMTSLTQMLEFSPDGQYLGAIVDDGTLWCWRLGASKGPT